MSNTTITKYFYAAGELTDPTSIKLSDPTSTYGVRRSDTQATVVADDTDMTKISTGVYQHTFTDPAYDLTYEYYVEVVYNGETYHFSETKAGTVTPVTSTLTTTGEEIITGALQDLGWLAAGATANADDITDCLKILNRMIKQMQAGPNSVLRGMKMWLRTEGELTLSAKAQYTLQASGGDLDIEAPVDVLSVLRRTTDDVDALLDPMTLGEYLAIGSKSAVGTPTRWMYEKKLGVGCLTFDRIPSDTTDTAIITYLRQITALADEDANVDFDAAYHDYLRLRLAKRIAPMFPGTNPESLKMVIGLAEEARQDVQNFFPEDTDAYFQPDLDD